MAHGKYWRIIEHTVQLVETWRSSREKSASCCSGRPGPREPPLEKPGRSGWRETGALKRVGRKLERAGMGRPPTDPES